MRKILRPAIALACVILLLYCSGSSRDEVRILFTGDILLSQNIRNEYQKNGERSWQKLQTLLCEADVVIGNIEESVSQSGNQPVFDITSKDMSMLREAGFTTMTIDDWKNSTDQKVKEISWELNMNNISPVNFSNSPQFFTIKNIVFSVITMHVTPKENGDAMGQFPMLEMMQKIRLAETLSNVVIVFVHWDGELFEQPNTVQRRTADWLTKRGVDIVIGGHTHVLQKAEMVNGRPVIFSIGSLLLDQKYPVVKDSWVADVRIRQGKVFCTGIDARTADNSYFPQAFTKVNKVSKPVKIKNLFSISKYTFWPLSVNDELLSKTNLQVFYNNKRVKSKPLNGLVAVDIKKLDGRNDYLFTLERHYSNEDNKVGIRPYIYCFDEKNIYARWRGAALTWPLLLDAQISPSNHELLCALHLVDSCANLINLNPHWRAAAYRWNGFEFDVEADSAACESCRELYNDLLSPSANP